MADEVDMANDLHERWLQGRIEACQHELNQVVIAPNQECKNCGEKLDDGRPYCDEHCRDDHWQRIKADQRNRKYRG